MTWGNLAALRQTSIKRMLAYSSIAQAGYLLIGLTVGTLSGIQAMLFYLFTYAFMNIGAFAVVSLMEQPIRRGSKTLPWTMPAASSVAAPPWRS